jgi:hypothetical protein
MQSYMPYWSAGGFQGFGVTIDGGGMYPSSYQYITGTATWDEMRAIMRTPPVPGQGQVWIEPSKWSFLPWAEKGHYETYSEETTLKLKMESGFYPYFEKVRQRLLRLIDELSSVEMNAKVAGVDLTQGAYLPTKEMLAQLVDWYNKSMWGLGPAFPAYAYTCEMVRDPVTGNPTGEEKCLKTGWVQLADAVGGMTLKMLSAFALPVELFINAIASGDDDPGDMLEQYAKDMTVLGGGIGEQGWQDPKFGKFLMTSWSSYEPNKNQLITWQELYEANELRMESVRQNINKIGEQALGASFQTIKKTKEATNLQRTSNVRKATTIGAIISVIGIATTFFPGDR